MKALKILLYILLSIGALWMLLAFFARKDYHIERTEEINAPHEVVFEQVRLFKNFKNWSPWHVYDPNMKTEISGTDGEPGARYSWTGNDKAGKGYLLMKSVSPARIAIDVDWGTGASPAFFSLEDIAGKKTKVSWAMDMHVDFPWNAFAMLTDVNAFVGKDFENGLVNLKRVCEQIAHPKYRGYEVAETDIPVTYYLGIRKVVDTTDITAYYTENLPKIMQAATNKKLTLAGPPSGLFWTWGVQTDMAAAIPIAENTKIDSMQTFPAGGKALVIEYFGPYGAIGEAHRAMDDYMIEKKLHNIPPVIEAYMTDPSTEPDTLKWLTKVIYFVEPKPDSTAVEKK
ncbi:MAG TPA: SRPBCC family protein [Saprospiraceae bacterium]|nr:SRPBCC family protein [Saprospiraceae bacterium]